MMKKFLTGNIRVFTVFKMNIVPSELRHRLSFTDGCQLSLVGALLY